MDNMFEVLEMVKKNSENSKKLAFLVSKANSPDELMELSLEQLMLSQRLESVLQSMAHQKKVMSQVVTKGFKEQSPQELEVNEVIKLGRKLPRWARNKGQINTQILSCFLRVSEAHVSVTESVLRDEFVRSSNRDDPRDQFNKNFPQMKMISEKNHGKVFDVVDGEVKIWPPANDIVETFKEIYNKNE